MAVGEKALVSTYSYLALGRETTLGSAVTCTGHVDFISAGMKTMKEGKILEELTLSRTYSDRIGLGKRIEGNIECYYRPEVDALNHLLQNAFGGTVTAATVTAAASYTHTFQIGNLDAQTHPSLSINMRKGDGVNGKCFIYTGVRVNEFGITAEIDDALKMSFSLLGMDSTAGTDISAGFTGTVSSPLSFVSGRLSVANTMADLTSTSFWHVQNINFNLSNSLKADNESRRIGSDVLDALPQGVATMELGATMRFDTTTAYDAMLEGTQLAAEFEFLGATLAGSSVRSGIKFRFPKLYIKDAGDPEIGGPDEIITSEVSFDVLTDRSTTTGCAVQAIVTNATATY